MNKKIILISFLVLAGCGETPEGNLPEPQKTTKEFQQTNTAIYLPGGVGIDFGMPPYKDMSGITDKGRRFKDIRYEISGAFSMADEQLKKILTDAGYSRKENLVSKDDIRVTYQKGNNNPIDVRYTWEVKEGFTKKAVVSLWWYEKNATPKQ